MALPILKQTHIVTGQHNKDMMYEALHKQVEDRIFKDLINGELCGVKVTFIIETLETEKHVEGA